MVKNKAVIISLDKSNNEITFSFDNLELDHNKIYAFKFYISNGDEFILHPFKIDFQEIQIEFIYTWLFDIDLYLDKINIDDELEYEIIETFDLDSIDKGEKINIMVDQHGLPNIRQLLDKLNDDRYNLYYFGKDNNSLFNQFIDITDIRIEERRLNKELLNEYDGLKSNLIIASGSKYFNDLIKKQYPIPNNFFWRIFKKHVVFFDINLEKESNILNKNYTFKEDFFEEGTFKKYNSKLNPKERNYLLEGIKVYYKNGQIVQEEEGIFKNIIRRKVNFDRCYLIKGKHKYYENGQIDEVKEGIFKENKLNRDYQLGGKGKIYLPDCRKEGIFKDGELNGKGAIYYTNDQIKKQGTFKDGFLFGKGITYFENGKVDDEGIFEDGILIKGIEYYNDKNHTIDSEGIFKYNEFLNEYDLAEGKLYEDGVVVEEGFFTTGSPYYKEDSTLFKGTKYHKNGEIEEGLFVHEFLIEGTKYNKNGEIKEVVNLKNNYLNYYDKKYVDGDGDIFTSGSTYGDNNENLFKGTTTYDNYEIKEKGLFFKKFLIEGTKYDENGEIIEVVNLKNNYLNYYDKKYEEKEDDNYILIEEGFFSFDKLNGEGKRYYYYDNEEDEHNNGKIWKEGIFKDGVLIEGKIYNENGIVRKEGIFKDGVLTEDGVLIEGIINYKSGIVWKKGFFKDDKLNGEGIMFYENQQVMKEGIFKDDRLNGKGIWYYNNGTVFMKDNFKDDKLDGKGTRYYQNGNVWKKGTFKDGKLNGEGIVCYQNGKVCKEGNFKFGNLNGICKIYFENGKILAEGKFYGRNKFNGKEYSRNGKLEREGILNYGYLENGKIRIWEIIRKNKN
jgi:antitoxin component YwqK of YwqJK toxin-antitoxin module